MAELIDPRPSFTLVMGCNGAGKTIWKRVNEDMLPEIYFDQDSIAGGLGGWDNARARTRTREIVDADIDKCFDNRWSFGMESTFSGRPGPNMLQRALEENYRTIGYYIGTENWEINAKRIERRVLSATGHYVNPDELPNRYRWSLSNLRRHFSDFDALELIDNSAETPSRLASPISQLYAEKGTITSQLPLAELAGWCGSTLQKMRIERERNS